MAESRSDPTSRHEAQPEPGTGFWAVTLGNVDSSAEGWLVERIEVLLDERDERNSPVLVGVAGSVAVGKTNLAGQIARELTTRRPGIRSMVVATDSFLMSNQELERLDLSMRKGFPETFDYRAMVAAISSVRRGQTVAVPEYSHVEYDIVEGSYITIDNPDVVIIEGVNVLQEPPTVAASTGASSALATSTGSASTGAASTGASSGILADLLDLAVYIDADPADIAAWYVDRFLRLCEEAGVAERSHAAQEDFYAGFVGMTTDAIRSIAEWTWNQINEPNLREYIRPSMVRADVIIQKDSDHQTRGLLQRRR